MCVLLGMLLTNLSELRTVPVLTSVLDSFEGETFKLFLKVVYLQWLNVLDIRSTTVLRLSI